MANPQVQAGTTAALPIQGTYARGMGGWDGGGGGARSAQPMSQGDVWCIDNNAYAVVAEHAVSGASGGYNAAPSGDGKSLVVTIPSSAASGTSFAVYVAQDGTGASGNYNYAVFDILPAGLPLQVTFTGAGKSADNVTALLQSANDDDGLPYYIGSGIGVYFNNYLSAWYIANPSQGVNNNWTSSGGALGFLPSYVDYYSAQGQTTSAFPMTPWTVANGPAPAPFAAAPRGAALADTVLLDRLSAGAAYRAGGTFSDAALVDGGVSGGVVHTKAGRGASFLEQPLQGSVMGGVLGRPAATLSDGLLLDFITPQPKTFPPLAFSDALLLDAMQPAPRTFAAARLVDVLIAGSIARTGVSVSGGMGAATLLLDSILTGAGITGGVISRLPQALYDVLLNGTLNRTSLSRTGRFSDALLFDRLVGFPAQSVSLPGQPDERDPFFVLAQELRLLLSLKGSSMTLVSTLLAVTDKISAAYRVNEISQAANTLATLPALIRGGDGVADKTYGFGQDGPILALLPAAESLLAGSAPNIILTAQYRGFMSALAGYASSLGFPSFDAYLSSLNTPAPFSALVHPNFALLNWLYNGQKGTLLMSPGNVFAPQTVFGTAAAVSGSLAFTHLSDIPSANALSQTPGQSAQGYSAAPGISALVTAAISGTLTATLTAFGQNAAGQAVAGRLWTAVLDNAAAGSAVAFIPQVAGDRLHGITSLVGTGTATAGAITLNSMLERVVA